ncbi:bifunctional 23S rRNA (guanine(2069)-N(7))-methyltransferase RlmK/23S rRNA (guanine(2445)-N(2))-methyltransferase RlmL [Alkalilimnicola sp. S0819]|uniref:bifunctional 23S rRNA (guanine(2069)-N(7))-methyltransferase RlmK/23S rRNA (guanine(2445)-N(2))-methyltransferase RlmL n=1 Tax=Alkalilimnicola sp. S0819 TaxID=2613922 RepID=UPI00126202A0|nr:bifunctional 23S rRNA (guanine(2069)-N(7))-methyltransferase RlmK/23S rRNA (guanine(2445)-N(2))-methyltransferase RlmL [Alkalilimnicola sp. S0819]KAB7622572.1 bifunctional 23S rRNA (guanine(2069)-N(7))-methyltransferase RlmK/23S rRNA (guanine(2445)-N(2))-methyltransferase RlmL [Alkalilimnicola sp. S0819]MPQ17460.1 bifunctional 23S rRNA (guanine(2069)-N(7))-methyltransferase RlmK/23S rRNA (guanine(2445)-N(2))-methyltransferase RlmL [Alkalilimnicola sp. S0819]
MQYFATCARGLEPLLAEELAELGAQEIRQRPAGVAFQAQLPSAYRVCLWTRLASRVLLQLTEFVATDGDALYQGALTLPWNEHMSATQRFAVEATGRSRGINNSHYAALRIKDAVVDHFRERDGQRPSVDTATPQIRLHCHIHRERAAISLDLSGASLHRRGYRLQGARAPLKETLAAAILLRARWPAFAAQGRPLLDPMCGSATLPIEAALMAADIAPGLLREAFGLEHWQGHRPTVWNELLDEARARREAGLHSLPRISGYDADASAVRTALENVERAGLRGHVHIEKRELDDLQPPAGEPGLVVVNPPYGERIGQQTQLVPLYARLGQRFREALPGWEAAVLQPQDDSLRLGLKPHHRYKLFNGALPCELGLFALATEKETETAPEFANRLRKNLRHLARWARREEVSCYRVYDADMPEYALAVDLYVDEQQRRWAHVQEYQAPPSVEAHRAARRLRGALAALPEALDVEPQRVAFKLRRRQKGSSQYQRLGERGEYLTVREGPARLRVNLHDYLDTGLFLDHRPVRLDLGRRARGKRFLNLFCYTGAATVHAGLGGALETTSVDLSSRYLDWAEDNLTLNGLGGSRHRLIQTDCLQWLEDGEDRGRYDLIFLDPPSFSNSKRMAQELDVQRDHAWLIRHTVELLRPGGLLIFSTNRRGFRLDDGALEGLEIHDVTKASIPPDFTRRPGIHQCFEIRRAQGDTD